MEEIEIQYGGTVSNVSIELDMTSRSKVMKIIDRARAQGQVMRLQPYRGDALFHMDGSGFKVKTNDKNQDILVRMPLHQVASVSYVFEDDQHIISIKYGEVDSKKNYNMDSDEDLICHMVVVFCDTKMTAIRLCNSVEQFFEDAYAKERVNAFSQYDTEDKAQSSRVADIDHAGSALTQPSYSFLSNSSMDLRDPGDKGPSPRRTSADSQDVIFEPTPFTTSELNNVGEQLIRDYMAKLYNVMEEKELEEFAKLVKAWHSDMSINEFCQRLLVLYGPEKKYLLPEMRPFIPAKDYPFFEAFLEENVHS